MYAWPSVVTIRIEIIIIKTQIFLNIQHRRSPKNILFLRSKLFGRFSFFPSRCGTSDQTSSSGARPPQDVVDVSQTPAAPALKKFATDKAVLL